MLLNTEIENCCSRYGVIVYSLVSAESYIEKYSRRICVCVCVFIDVTSGGRAVGDFYLHLS